jgi:DmsE family decaheme c-type cytochrome
VTDCRRDSHSRLDVVTIFCRPAKEPLQRFVAFAWVMFWCCILLTWAQGSTAKQTSSQNLTDPTSGSTYVGTDTCKTCHEDKFHNIEASPHYRTNLPKIRGEEVHGCESCHGPGSAHVAGGGDVTKIFTFTGVRPEAITQRCMSCHEANPEQNHFLRSTHNQNGVTCTSCHSVHHSTLENLLVQKQTQLCFSCHVEQKADFQKPFHHRVEEGLIKCNDCHNPHGEVRDRQLRSTADGDMICFKCHSDKRGPFVFEHEPVKGEGCQTCHTAHGSPYPRMLLTARVNSLCLQCHVTIPAGPHPQNAIRQDCILCHMSIHGSNIDPRFFR